MTASNETVLKLRIEDLEGSLEKEPEVEPPKIEPGDDCPNKNCKGTLKQAEVLYGDDILQCKECGQPVDIPTD